MLSIFLVLAVNGCSPDGLDHEQLEVLESAEFVIEDQERREAFLLDLPECADARSPFFRDQIGYEGMAAILRRDEIGDETLRSLYQSISTVLRADNETVDRRYGKKRGGFRASFLTLQLSEVARRDRVLTFLSEEERQDLVVLAAEELRDVTDYRGFDDDDGWRHHVAHASDLVLQVALNGEASQEERQLLIDALLAQVQPEGVSYHFGEPERLARAFLYAVVSSDWTTEDISTILEPLGVGTDRFSDAYTSEAGLARLHNTRAFLDAIIIAVTGQDEPRLMALGAMALEARRALP